MTFNGTLSCTSASGVETYIDLATQIVLSSAAVATANGPGGTRHTLVLDRVWNFTTQSPTVDINLASTRVIPFQAGGQKRIYFRITKLRMDPFTACSVFNPVFTVLYLS